MRPRPAPAARAARTNSRSRSARTSARTRRAIGIQPVRPRMRTTESIPGRTIAARPRSRKSRGKDCSASSTRRMSWSTAGGALPESAPSGTATSEISSTVQAATASDTRPPASRRAATSRPNSSLPSAKRCDSISPRDRRARSASVAVARGARARLPRPRRAIAARVLPSVRWRTSKRLPGAASPATAGSSWRSGDCGQTSGRRPTAATMSASRARPARRARRTPLAAGGAGAAAERPAPPQASRSRGSSQACRASARKLPARTKVAESAVPASRRG